MQPLALRTWRQQRGWTLDDAAHYLGTTKTSVHRWEVGRHPIPQTIAILILLLAEKKNIRKVQHFLYTPLAQ